MPFLVTFIGLLPFADSSAAPRPVVIQPNGIEVVVPSAPVVVRTGRSDQLTYEVHVTNLGRPATLARLEVNNPDTRTVLAAFDGAALAALLGRPGLAPSAQHETTVGAGLRAVLYIDLPVRGSSLPSRLAHRLTFDRPPPASPAELERFNVEAGPTLVDHTTSPTFGPPLRDGPWAAVYDPALDRGHRRVLYAVDGHARIPGRFAIDWFRVDTQGRTRPAPDTPDRLVAFYGYGAEVLAVADGVVAAACDGVRRRA